VGATSQATRLLPLDVCHVTRDVVRTPSRSSPPSSRPHDRVVSSPPRFRGAHVTREPARVRPSLGPSFQPPTTSRTRRERRNVYPPPPGCEFPRFNLRKLRTRRESYPPRSGTLRALAAHLLPPLSRFGPPVASRTRQVRRNVRLSPPRRPRSSRERRITRLGYLFPPLEFSTYGRRPLVPRPSPPFPWVPSHPGHLPLSPNSPKRLPS